MGDRLLRPSGLLGRAIVGESQSLVNASLRVLMVAEVAAAAWATLCVLESAVPAELRGAMLLADVLQVGSAVWIMRYSRE